MDTDNLKKVALETAQRFLDYRSYGSKEAKAIAAMKRRCPGFSKEDYSHWFQRAVTIHRDCVEFLKEEADQIWPIYKENPEHFSLENIATDFISQYNDFCPNEILHQLTFAFYNHHLR